MGCEDESVVQAGEGRGRENEKGPGKGESTEIKE